VEEGEGKRFGRVLVTFLWLIFCTFWGLSGSLGTSIRGISLFGGYVAVAERLLSWRGHWADCRDRRSALLLGARLFRWGQRQPGTLGR
jgi:hypothetical protein